ncbi:MAG: GNAT family N-acetyltransferase [Syntrophorhabdaceae bacterium]|nr:GNAT family N-acetyltransferase [Syntrophorhabdaceae bacterium]
MLNPQSVALIGATEREGSMGKAVLMNLLPATNRTLYAVNPNRKSVLGIPSFPSVGDIPSRVDLAVIVTPAHTVPAIVRECGDAGVAGAIILSAGFGEAGPEGKGLERELVDIRNKYGLRIIGPNCLGVILPHIGLNCTFLSTDPKPGQIAIISQSGALGDAILDWGGAMGIGFSAFVSLGSMIDVGFGDFIDFLSQDYWTKSILIYMEYVGDARGFISAARGFAMTKPLIVLKPGRWKGSAQAIAAHTGGRTGNDRVYDAVFKRVGVVRVREVSDLFNMAEVLDSRHLPRGPKLAIITNTGSVGIIASDTLAEFGGELACLSDESAKELDSFLPEQWSRNNPIDIVADADLARYMDTVAVCLDDDGVDGILVAYAPRAVADAIELARALIEASRKTAKSIVAVWMGGERAAEGRRILLQSNVPAYATPEEAVKTYLYMYSYRRNIDLLYETPAERGQTGAPLKNYVKATVRNAARARQHWLSASHSLDLLANYQISTTRTTVLTDIDSLGKVLDVGFPLLLKLRHPGEGREDKPVLLNDEREAREACEEARRRLFLHDTDRGRDVEIILQKPAAPGSHKVKLELRRDPEFRSIVVLSPGSGAQDDVCIGLPPLNQVLARRLLEGIAIYPQLKDTDAGRQALKRLEDVLLGFSDLVVDFPEIESADLVLWVRQSDVLAGDVKIVPCQMNDRSSVYPHLVITPYPLRYITTWRLPDGTEALLRPIRPEDEPMSREMLDTLSEESLRVRFFSVREITRDLLIRSCNTDYDREIAIIAEIQQDGKKRMIGGNRLISEPGTRKGQFAILIHDDFQRMGLGAKLIDILIGIAQEKQLDEIYGLVLTENEKMLTLCRKLGFKVEQEPDGLSRVTLSLKA